MLFRDRADAGKALAARLQGLAAGWHDPLLLALPRGGIAVGAEAARLLNIPLTVFIVRKLGAPGNPEFAIGALAEGGAMVLMPGWSVEDEHVRETAKLEEERIIRYAKLYRGEMPLPSFAGRTLVIVDDGAATGATVMAGLKLLRSQDDAPPAAVVVALPVAPAQAVKELRKLADEVIALHTPPDFFAVSRHYCDFSDMPDETLRKMVAGAGSQQSGPR